MNLLKAVEDIRKKLLFRMDADGEENEEEPENKGAKRFSALSTRLPFGIAKDLGIDTKGMTPREVWDKISGEGVSPKSAMNEKLSAPDKKVSVSKSSKKLDKITVDSFPENLSGTAINKKETEIFCDRINDSKGSDSTVGKLFRGIKSLWEKCTSPSIKYAERKHVANGRGQLAITYNPLSGKIVGCKVKVPKITNAESAATVAHELGHYIDALCGDGTVKGQMASYANKTLKSATSKERFHDESEISQDAWKMMKDVSDRAYHEYKSECDELNKKLEECNKKYVKGEYSSSKEYNKEFDKIKREGLKRANEKHDGIVGSCGKLMDMYDAMSKGEMYLKLRHGHGKKYYSREGSVESELFANYCSLSLFDPDLLKHFEKDFPETSEELRKHADRILERMG